MKYNAFLAIGCLVLLSVPVFAEEEGSSDEGYAEIIVTGTRRAGYDGVAIAIPPPPVIGIKRIAILQCAISRLYRIRVKRICESGRFRRCYWLPSTLQSGMG